MSIPPTEETTMAVSKKASVRKTSPRQAAASQQAAAQKAQREKAESQAARDAQSARAVGKSGAKGMRAHAQTRTKRRQAASDSR
jgi:hypothetical protein